MFYRLLGMAVWKGTKQLLYLKYGRTYMPKRVWAGLVLVVGVAALLVARSNGSEN